MNPTSTHITQSLQLAWWKAAAAASEKAVTHRRVLLGALRLAALAALAAGAYGAGVLVGQVLTGLHF